MSGVPKIPLNSWSDREIENQLVLLISRLERLSADSHYAHLASGFRGALLRDLQSIRSGRNLRADTRRKIQEHINQSYVILQAAAQEIRGWQTGQGLG